MTDYICPSWCQNDTCRKSPVGEHYTEGEAVTASGANLLGRLVDRDWTAAHIPLVNLRGVFNPCDGDDAPSISVMVSDGSNEAEVYLRIREAEQLIGELQSHLDLLQEPLPHE